MAQPDMSAPVPANLPPALRAAVEALCARASSLTRHFAALLRDADPARRAKRPDEAAWCCAAVGLAALRGRWISHRRSGGDGGGRPRRHASRAVQDAVALGLMRQEPLPGNRRIKRSASTDAGWRLLAAGAPEAFAEVAASVRSAEARSAFPADRPCRGLFPLRSHPAFRRPRRPSPPRGGESRCRLRPGAAR